MGDNEAKMNSSKILSVISHDLRAPISTIKMINAIIESKKDEIGSPEIVRLFEMINSTTDEAFHLLENLLRWSRRLNGTTKVFKTKFNLTPAIRQLLGIFQSASMAKNIEIVYKQKDDIFVTSDEDMIRTVIRNLLSNALKYTHPYGKIEIDVHREEDYVLISVADSGIGMDDATQDKIKENHQHISYQGTNNEKGSGLGLMLCYEFAQMLDGQLAFISKLNEGTTFFLKVPTI